MSGPLRGKDGAEWNGTQDKESRYPQKCGAHIGQKTGQIKKFCWANFDTRERERREREFDSDGYSIVLLKPYVAPFSLEAVEKLASNFGTQIFYMHRSQPSPIHLAPQSEISNGSSIRQTSQLFHTLVQFLFCVTFQKNVKIKSKSCVGTGGTLAAWPYLVRLLWKADYCSKKQNLTLFCHRKI